MGRGRLLWVRLVGHVTSRLRPGVVCVLLHCDRWFFLWSLLHSSVLGHALLVVDDRWLISETWNHGLLVVYILRVVWMSARLWVRWLLVLRSRMLWFFLLRWVGWHLIVDSLLQRCNPLRSIRLLVNVPLLVGRRLVLHWCLFSWRCIDFALMCLLRWHLVIYCLFELRWFHCFFWWKLVYHSLSKLVLLFHASTFSLVWRG